jgi:hypothetical protein
MSIEITHSGAGRALKDKSEVTASGGERQRSEGTQIVLGKAEAISVLKAINEHPKAMRARLLEVAAGRIAENVLRLTPASAKLFQSVAKELQVLAKF